MGWVWFGLGGKDWGHGVTAEGLDSLGIIPNPHPKAFGFVAVILEPYSFFSSASYGERPFAILVTY